MYLKKEETEGITRKHKTIKIDKAYLRKTTQEIATITTTTTTKRQKKKKKNYTVLREFFKCNL